MPWALRGKRTLGKENRESQGPRPLRPRALGVEQKGAGWRGEAEPWGEPRLQTAVRAFDFAVSQW